MSIWDWIHLVVTGEYRLYAVNGLETTSLSFQRKLIGICDRHGMTANYLTAVISFESAGTFRADQWNMAGSGAVGLIQLMPGSASYLGTTTAALAAMTALEQLTYVERYYEAIIRTYGPVVSLEQHYTAVLAGRPYSADEVLKLTPEMVARNAALDANRDGEITGREATAPVRRILDAGERGPRIVVPMKVPPEIYPA